MTAGMRKKSLFFGVCFVWVSAIFAGESILLNYSTAPGSHGKIQTSWPGQTPLLKSPDRPTLLMFVHPKCPCSKASLGELALLMTHCREKVSAQIVFLKPEKFPEEWAKTDLWKDALAIPGVKIHVDEQGEEAARFGALTSGQTLLYGTDGQLLFEGGITASRGHSGDNAGRSAVESILLKGTTERKETPVFGCSLAERNIKLLKGIFFPWKQ